MNGPRPRLFVFSVSIQKRDCRAKCLNPFWEDLAIRAVGLHPIANTRPATEYLAHMKQHKHNHHSALNVGTQLMPIRFEFTHSTAASVSIAGTFNNWDPTTIPMQRSGNGWLEEAALAPGNYEYCFVVDGSWMPDPLAKKDVPNPFGGRNSILEVAACGKQPTKDSPAANTKKPKITRV